MIPAATYKIEVTPEFVGSDGSPVQLVEIEVIFNGITTRRQTTSRGIDRGLLAQIATLAGMKSCPGCPYVPPTE